MSDDNDTEAENEFDDLFDGIDLESKGDGDLAKQAIDDESDGIGPFDAEQAAAIREKGDRLGTVLGALLAAPYIWLAGVLAGFLVAASRKIPGRQRIQKWMIENGVEGLWRTSDAHMIAMTIYGDRAVVPRPAELDTEEGKVRTNNDEEWTATDVIPCRMGDAPVVWAVADDHELSSPVKARIAEAVDNDFRTVQTVRETDEGIAKTEYQSPQAAVADGGELSNYREPFDDVWIDARNPIKDASGWIVSMAKAYDLHWSQSSSEEMKKQETRGRLSELDPEKYEGRAIRLVLLFAAGLGVGLFGPALATRLAGGAGGDGVSIGLSIMSQLPTLGVI